MYYTCICSNIWPSTTTIAGPCFRTMQIKKTQNKRLQFIAIKIRIRPMEKTASGYDRLDCLMIKLTRYESFIPLTKRINYIPLLS